MAGRLALEAIAEENASGYAILAQFQDAASYASGGERLVAISAFEDSLQQWRLRQKNCASWRVYAQLISHLPEGRDAVLAHLGNLDQ